MTFSGPSGVLILFWHTRELLNFSQILRQLFPLLILFLSILILIRNVFTPLFLQSTFLSPVEGLALHALLLHYSFAKIQSGPEAPSSQRLFCPLLRLTSKSPETIHSRSGLQQFTSFGNILCLAYPEHFLHHIRTSPCLSILSDQVMASQMSSSPFCQAFLSRILVLCVFLTSSCICFLFHISCIDTCLFPHTTLFDASDSRSSFSRKRLFFRLGPELFTIFPLFYQAMEAGRTLRSEFAQRLDPLLTHERNTEPLLDLDSQSLACFFLGLSPRC